MSTASTIVRQGGEGERLWFAGGGLFTIKATSAETGGAFTMLEDRVVRGKTTPLHVHPDVDEAIYVLEGELTVWFDGNERTVGEHGFFFAPRGVPHAFMCTSETAHFLAIQTPGAAEEFYRQVTEPAASEDDATRPPDWARLRAVAERSPHIEILGPPPFAAREEAAATTPA